MAMLDVYRIEIFGEVLRWIGPDGRLLDERPLVGVEALVAEVEKALGDPTRKPDLRAVGRRLFRWLDGERRWLAGALGQKRGLTLLIDVGQRLRHLPWELCCDEGPFLVGAVGQPFHPVRRVLARRPEPHACANRPLRMLFVACSPENVEPVLEFEAEEALILAATKGREIELVVEESGSLEGLTERLVDYGAGYFDVLHLSGHAVVVGDQPVFIMEDSFGQREDVTPARMAEALSFVWPRLVFLSGCETGRAPDAGQLPSFCEQLVAQGAPLVLGWSLPVGDRHATLAASELYAQLSASAPLDQAISQARRALLEADSPFWQLLRCYGDDSPLAALVTPLKHKGRARLQLRPVHTQFVDAGAQLQVCAPEAFVGRRRVLQRCLRILLATPDETERYHEGLLLTGMGGLGKSSLAVRLCNRQVDRKPLVWVGRIDELSLLDRLNRALDLPGPEGLLYQPETSLFKRLRDLFKKLAQPLLLIFDDFEQNGELDPSGQPSIDDQGRLRLRPQAQAPLRDLLEALRESASVSRVIITCRYAIVPPSAKAQLHREPLDHFSGADLTKKLRRLTGFALPARADLAARARQLADGNPRLLETFDSLLGQPTLADAQLDQLLGQLEAAAEAFREQNLLTGLLALLDPASRLLLAKLSLCQLPIPAEAVATLADEATLSRGLDRAVSLGLVERIGNKPVTLYVSYLLEPMLAPLLDDEARQRCQGDLADQLYRCWWLEQEGFVWAQAWELRRLALAAHQAQRVGEITAILANRFNLMSRYREAYALCKESLSLAADSRVLTELGDAEGMLGQTLAAKTHLEEAVALDQSSAYMNQQRVRSKALHDLANLLRQQGEVERALTLWQESLALDVQIGDVQGKAATLHEMAGVIAQRGEVERALALWQESLALLEQNGDAQGKAAILNDMATMIAERGEVERALALWQESLALKERIGDVRGKAATFANMAWASTQQGKLAEARLLYLEAVQALAVVHAWPDVLTVLCNLGSQKDALALHQALWLMIRIQAPLEGSLSLLSYAFKQEDNDPRLPPLLVATALHLVHVRDQNHARLHDFLETAAGMLGQLLPADKRSQEGIQEWYAQPDHHDPRLFLPRLNEVLEELIGDGWYFDRSPLLERGFT